MVVEELLVNNAVHGLCGLSISKRNYKRMDKETHLHYLREKYIQLSRQYLQELQSGKKIRELEDMAELISSLVVEIDAYEQELNNSDEQ